MVIPPIPCLVQVWEAQGCPMSADCSSTIPAGAAGDLRRLKPDVATGAVSCASGGKAVGERSVCGVQMAALYISAPSYVCVFVGDGR